jgi:hypothetical protein
VKAAAAWTLAVLLAAAALAAQGKATRDPDSLLYARIAAAMSEQPLKRWIAPQWPSGSYGQGYFREHPVGLFVPAAALARLGYPAEQAAFAVNLLYQALSLVLLARLAATLLAGPEARALAWALQLLPLAFAYRVRANHEQPLLMLLAAALLGLEHARRDARWSLLAVAGLSGVLLVKGVLAAPAFLVCLAWLAIRRAGRRAWLSLALSLAALAAVAAVYESSYRAATGESFLSTYLGRQVLSGHLEDPLERIGAYAYTLAWYGARLLWFAFPWSLVALAALPRLRRGGSPDGWIALAVTLLYLLPFSASERRAERYLSLRALGGPRAVPGPLRLPCRRRPAAPPANQDLGAGRRALNRVVPGRRGRYAGDAMTDEHETVQPPSSTPQPGYRDPWLLASIAVLVVGLGAWLWVSRPAPQLERRGEARRERTEGRSGMGRSEIMQRIAASDRDADGYVTPAEAEAALGRDRASVAFKKLDRDHDNRLSKEELAARGARRSAPASSPPGP